MTAEPHPGHLTARLSKSDVAEFIGCLLYIESRNRPGRTPVKFSDAREYPPEVIDARFEALKDMIRDAPAGAVPGPAARPPAGAGPDRKAGPTEPRVQPLHVMLSYPRVIRKPWIEKLVSEVEKRLWEMLGSRYITVWWDGEIEGHRSYPRELRDRVVSAQAFLFVHSTGYYKSKWCLSELFLYLSRFEELQYNNYMVIKVEFHDLKKFQIDYGYLKDYLADCPAERCQEIATRHKVKVEELQGYRFWGPEPKIRWTLGQPEMADYEPTYHKIVTDLSAELASFLEARIDELSDQADPAPGLRSFLEQYDNDRRAIQERISAEELMRFVAGLQLAVQTSVDTDKPVDFETALRDQNNFAKRRALFDALMDLVAGAPD
jgi:hypothetical protein